MHDSTGTPERWLPVRSYEGLYEVSDRGSVRSLDRMVVYAVGGVLRQWKSRGRTMKTFPNRTGHLRADLCRDGKKKGFSVHVLVLEAFVEARPPGMEGCHNNGDPSDNRLENLRWGSHSENQLDQVRHGNHNKARRTHCPRRHPLETPNLTPAQLRKGGRNCLACDRARARMRYMKKKSPAAAAAFDLQGVSDAYYAEILKQAA